MSLLAKKDTADEYGVWISKREDYIDQLSSRSIREKLTEYPSSLKVKTEASRSLERARRWTALLRAQAEGIVMKKMLRVEEGRDDEYRRRADGDSWQISPFLIWYAQLRSPSLKDE